MTYDDGQGAFFKNDNGKLRDGRVLHGPGWVLDWNIDRTAEHDGYKWFDSEQDARTAYNLPPEEEEEES